ncbi:MAG: hypothetical protein QG665_391 [Patescibacteria group bacterium]|nr:hypothetical protein [Patescibacteria group bacterium]
MKKINGPFCVCCEERYSEETSSRRSRKRHMCRFCFGEESIRKSGEAVGENIELILFAWEAEIDSHLERIFPRIRW